MGAAALRPPPGYRPMVARNNPSGDLRSLSVRSIWRPEGRRLPALRGRGDRLVPFGGRSPIMGVLAAGAIGHACAGRAPSIVHEATPHRLVAPCISSARGPNSRMRCVRWLRGAMQRLTWFSLPLSPPCLASTPVKAISFLGWISQRMTARSQEVVGCLVNVLPLRIRVDDSISFADLLGEVRLSVTRALANGRFPLARLIERLARHATPTVQPFSPQPW